MAFDAERATRCARFVTVTQSNQQPHESKHELGVIHRVIPIEFERYLCDQKRGNQQVAHSNHCSSVCVKISLAARDVNYSPGPEEEANDRNQPDNSDRTQQEQVETVRIR